MSDWNKEDSNLYKHAKRELDLAGLLDPNGENMYGDMLGKAVLELVECFAKQGHSGMSASITIHLLTTVLDFKPLSPLTFKPDEWNLVGTDMWQNNRKSTVFSDDLKTWYDIEEGDHPHPRHVIEVR